MDCPKCGNRADDDAAFCSACGNDLNAARAAAAAQERGEPSEPAAPEPTAPTAPMPAAETAPMAAAADAAAQAEYDAEMAQYRRDLAAWQAQYGPDRGAAIPPDAAIPGAGTVPPDLPPKKSHAGLIIAGCLIALLLCAIVSCSSALVFRSALSSLPVLGGVTATGGASGSGARSPQGAIQAWYAAVADGDLDEAKRISTPDYGATLESDVFDGPQDFRHAIVRIDVDGDSATVVVHQTSPEVPGTVTLTFTLTKGAGGGWLVADVEVTDDTVPGSSAATPEPDPLPAPAEKPAAPSVIDEKTAIDTVGRFLEAAKSDDLAGQRRLTTTRFKAANPTWITKGTSEALISFEVVKAVRKGDVWLVSTNESWISGPETPTWTVVTQKGEGRVDRMSGLE